jgi:hypothetical protein
MPFMHASRWRALWHVVVALLVGRQLWLTALGRALPTSAQRKHAIKSVDRLLGNRHLQRDRFRIAQALVRTFIRPPARPVVLIDTVEIRHKVVAVTASLAHDGRSFPFWSTTLRALRLNARQCRRFLKELSAVLPAGVVPILVTDGGFEADWLDEVERHGWDYVARVRGQTKVLHAGEWIGCHELHRMATNRARNLGTLSFPKKAARKRRLVLSKLPTSRHRRKKTRRGHDNDNNYKHYRKNAHEPLLLATSLTCRPAQIVAIYKLRMQIEESFRDLKCYRWGWSLRHCRTRTRARLELLLLVAAIAMWVQQVIGIAAESQGLERRHQANTITTRRVLSIFLLGALVISSGDHALLGTPHIRAASRRLRTTLCRSHPVVEKT